MVTQIKLIFMEKQIGKQTQHHLVQPQVIVKDISQLRLMAQIRNFITTHRM